MMYVLYEELASCFSQELILYFWRHQHLLSENYENLLFGLLIIYLYVYNNYQTKNSNAFLKFRALLKAIVAFKQSAYRDPLKNSTITPLAARE